LAVQAGNTALCILPKLCRKPSAKYTLMYKFAIES
jgi:hypothetical protein